MRRLRFGGQGPDGRSLRNIKLAKVIRETGVRRWFCYSRFLSKNLTSIADAKDTDDDAPILNIANDAPVANTVFPVSAKLPARQGLADIAGIVQ
jgi:hypothetical protein